MIRQQTRSKALQKFNSQKISFSKRFGSMLINDLFTNSEAMNLRLFPMKTNVVIDIKINKPSQF